MKAEKIDLIGAVTINALDDSTKALVNNALSSTVTYNGVKIDASNGLVVTKSDNKVKTKINATDGIKIQKVLTELTSQMCSGQIQQVLSMLMD